MEEAILILEAKGYTNVREVIKDLTDHGVFSHADASRYVAVNRFVERIATEDRSASQLIGDLAFEYSVGETTLRRIVAGLPILAQRA
jgi:hypothetical protein